MDMRIPEAPAPRGLFEALRALGGTLNEVARVRGALFAVELAEEVERRRRLLVLAAVGAALLHMALVLLSVLVAAVFWDTYRVAAIAVMTIVYMACGTAALLRMRRESAASPAPFAATLAEIDRDLSGLRTPQ